MSDYETLRIRRDGYVLVIGLNRPAKRNAFDKTMFEELALALGEYETDIDLRAAVLYGEGPMFTAGLDLASVAPNSRRRIVDAEGNQPVAGRRKTAFKPLLVAVHGKVLTLGIELALAADIVIADETATFAQLEINRGIYPFGGATIRFPAQPVGATRCGGC